jgi:hypothetical protein
VTKHRPIEIKAFVVLFLIAVALLFTPGAAMYFSRRREVNSAAFD